MDAFKVKEMGITVDSFFGNGPRMKAKQCNRKLHIFREFAVATLNALVKRKKGGKNTYITACDSFTGSGIAGLQWKKLLKSQVHVSMADHDDLSKLISNVTANSLKANQIALNSVRVPGDPFQSQEEDEVHIYRADARTILSMESFQFIYLRPYRNCSEYIESAFNSVNHGGIVCFVVSDATSFNRTPHVIRRQYGAKVIKTEYWREMAARIVLASMASAAGKCNKGIIPQYTVSIEDYLLVCVRVTRGHASTEAALNEVAQLMHCRFCEERVFVESQLAPDENPYSKLPCKCKQEHVGKTAVLLGPMWKGPIFENDFLCEMQQCGVDLKLSHNFSDTIALLISESSGKSVKINKEEVKSSVLAKDSNCNGGKDTKQNLSAESNNSACAGSTLHSISKDESSIQAQSVDSDTTSISSKHENPESRKRKYTEEDGEMVDVKKMHKEMGLGKGLKNLTTCQSINVPFYYNANNKIRTINLPKLDKLCSMLRDAGYYATRSHFDPSGIRTSATIEQFLNFLS